MAVAKDLTIDEQLDALPEQAAEFSNEPHLVKAEYRPEPGLELLILTLSDGARLLVPREDLPELKNATPEQASDVTVAMLGTSVWWPQLDDGIYFPEFLEFRWGNTRLVDRRDGGSRYRFEGLE
jgi:hypothetical protein